MQLHSIMAGTFRCDGGAIFGVVPKRVWQKRYPCNEENYCLLSMRCLLIKTDSRLILIDTGTGNKQLDYLKYYDFKDIVNFETELQKLGYSCGEVTDVVLTHLHFDHCGGATYYDEAGHIQITFPNATHWVGEAQWENFKSPNAREKDSYFRENMMPIEEAGLLRLVTQNEYLSPEVELRLLQGHTVGQLVPYLYGQGETTLYCGDVIPVAASIPIAWVSAYDTNPIASMEGKEALLREAVAKKQRLYFEHDAYTESCYVVEINGRIQQKK